MPALRSAAAIRQSAPRAAIATIGAALGLLLAGWLSQTLVSYLSTDGNRVYVSISTGWRVFGFAALLGISACLLFGLLPAWQATGTNPQSTIQASSRSATDSRERFGLRRALVVVQVALSLVAPSEAGRAQAIEELQGSPLTWQLLGELKDRGEPLLPPMHSLCIAAGRKDKLRPGDILGALTGEAGIPGDKVGKIAIFDYLAFVAVDRAIARQALQRLASGKIKGRAVKVRLL